MTVPRRVLIPVLVALVALAAATAYLFLRGDGPRPGVFAGERTSAQYAVIDTAALDPTPLTVAEVLGPQTTTLVSGGVTMVRGSSGLLDDCGEMLAGVAAEGCTQVLHAAYTSADRTVAGQFLLFNLTDGRAADALVSALGSSGFVRQTVAFDAARSRAQARALGHFVTVSWVGPAGGGDHDLVHPQIALDGLARAVVADRVIAAT